MMVAQCSYSSLVAIEGQRARFGLQIPYSHYSIAVTEDVGMYFVLGGGDESF